MTKDKAELVQNASILKKKILTMEWDLKQGQLHQAKIQKVKNLKEELKQIEEQIAGK